MFGGVLAEDSPAAQDPDDVDECDQQHGGEECAALGEKGPDPGGNHAGVPVGGIGPARCKY